MKPSNKVQLAPSDKQRGTVPVGIAPRWAAIIGSLTLGLLYLFLPDKLTIGPKWLLLILEVVLLLPLVLSRATRHTLSHRTIRILSLIVQGIVTAALAGSVFRLIYTLPENNDPKQLLISAGLLWSFNVIVFALWYWEIDGGGPMKRHLAGHQAADFMFPQQVNGNDGSWAPHFVDYVFLAFTGATALSPADTYPLTRVAKALMMIEAVLALVIIVLLAGRAINILH